MLNNAPENLTNEHDAGRDSWWRGHLRDTPIPGTYEFTDFVQELDSVKIKKGYGFKSSGRKISADPSRTGHYLMPGLYKINTFIESNNKRKLTYNFKSTGRENKHAVVVGIQDKDILNSGLSPVTYAKEYDKDQKLPSKHSAFKSESSRFPTVYFKPKVGPAPTDYATKSQCSKAVTSVFISKTPRFQKVHTLKTPGPGSYTKISQYPMPKHIHDVGRYHGIFFPSETLVSTFR